MTTSNPIQQLHTQFKRLRQFDILLFILAVLALILCFIDSRMALAVLGLSLILKLLLGKKRAKEYEKNFIHLSALLTLQRYLDNAQHRHAPVLTEQEIRDVRMLPCNAASGSVLCREGGTGSYHGRSVRLGDATLTHTFTVNNKKSHHFTVGCWVTVMLEADTGLDCRFIGENITPVQSLKEMLWVESDLKQTGTPLMLRSNWRVVCNEEKSAMPGDRFFRQLEDLHKKTNGQVAVCVQGNQLHILLAGDILARKVNHRIEPGPQLEYIDLLPNLPYALLLSDLLTP